MYTMLANRINRYIRDGCDDICNLRQAINGLDELELDRLDCVTLQMQHRFQNELTALLEWADNNISIEDRPRISHIFTPRYAPFCWLLSTTIKPSREIAALMLIAYASSSLVNALTHENALTAWKQRFFALDEKLIDTQYRPTFSGYRQQKQRLEQVQQIIAESYRPSFAEAVGFLAKQALVIGP